MSKKVLITGATGFIGSNVTRALAQKKFDLTAIIRPDSSTKRISDCLDQITIVSIDLADIDKLKRFLEQNSFDVIVHIGALRGGRNYSSDIYYKANVEATEPINALSNNSVFLFCSSVGVYGTIPNELPANINTEFQGDTHYHYTKIKAEAAVQKLILNGLQAVIIRPAITYGEDDYGFPYVLTKLVHKRLLFLPDVAIKIHLANIEIVTDAFYKLVEGEFEGCKIYNIADRYPVKMSELAAFISERLHMRKYPANRYISLLFFRKLERWAQSWGMEKTLNRIKLISNSWFFDTTDAYNELYLRHVKTIPDFKSVVDFYAIKKRIKKH